MRRYEAWGGMASQTWMEYFLGETDIYPGITSIWPIIDNQTCGEIHGSPTIEQFFCVAFSPEAQQMLCKLLNGE